MLKKSPLIKQASNTLSGALLFFCIIAWPAFVFSQRTSFIEFGVEQGLVQSQVQSIVQDNQGNLWVGTLGGLSKYNGKAFTNYSKKDSLAEDWVTTAYKDKKGNIWFGHWGGGLTMYDIETESFQNL